MKRTDPIPEPMFDRMAIGQRIKRARRNRSWTQKKLGAAVGVKISTVCNWERGFTLFHLPTAVKVAIVLRRSLEWLLFGVPKRSELWKKFRN